MEQSKVIRIDGEVYAELQRRARPFEDNPNTVLRRLLGLPESGQAVKTRSVEGLSMDARIARLVNLAGIPIDHVYPNLTGRWSVRCKSGKVIATMRSQSRMKRLWLATAEEFAHQAGVGNWQKSGPKKWHNTPGVVWYAPDGEEGAWNHVAEVLRGLHDL